jgi:hypothetical protein
MLKMNKMSVKKEIVEKIELLKNVRNELANSDHPQIKLVYTAKCEQINTLEAVLMLLNGDRLFF